MNKVTKKIIRSILLSSALSLLHTPAKAQNSLLPDFDLDQDESDEVGAIKRKVMKNVVKVTKIL